MRLLSIAVAFLLTIGTPAAINARISFKNLTPLREQFYIVWYTGDKILISEQFYKLLHGYSIPIDPPANARFFMIYSLDVSNNRLTADMLRIMDGKEYTIHLLPGRLMLWDTPVSGTIKIPSSGSILQGAPPESVLKTPKS